MSRGFQSLTEAGVRPRGSERLPTPPLLLEEDEECEEDEEDGVRPLRGLPTPPLLLEEDEECEEEDEEEEDRGDVQGEDHGAIEEASMVELHEETPPMEQDSHPMDLVLEDAAEEVEEEASEADGGLQQEQVRKKAAESDDPPSASSSVSSRGLLPLAATLSAISSREPSKSSRKLSKPSREPSKGSRQSPTPPRQSSKPSRRPSITSRQGSKSSGSRQPSKSSRGRGGRSRSGSKTSVASGDSLGTEELEQRPMLPGEDMGTPDWCGWAVGLYDGDCITFARSAPPPGGEPPRDEPSPAHPALAQAWEAPGEDEEEGEAWREAEEIRVTAPPTVPGVVHAWDCTGTLSGTYLMGDDVDGRTSYKREDSRITVQWSAEDQQWAMVASAAGQENKATEKDKETKQTLCKSAQVDVLDPTWLTVWQCMDKTTGRWIDYPGLTLNPGAMPPQQLYVSQCRYSSLEGVYNVLSQLVGGRPAYQKDSSSSDCAIRWHARSSIWLIDERGLKDDSLADARSRTSADQPHEAKFWEESAAGSADAGAEASSAVWAAAPQLSIVVVGAAPEQVFVEVPRSSPLAAARGVYSLELEKWNLRACFAKALGQWSCSWSPEQAAWYLQSSAKDQNAQARILYDVPEPVSYTSLSLKWEIWNEAAREWQKDESLILWPMPVPPRRLHVSGLKAKKDHVLFGVYFLRGMCNGRPSWAKETIASATGIHRSSQRGQIYWGGEQEPYWLVAAEPEAARVYKAKLHDDTPLPSERTIGDWDLEEPPPTEKERKMQQKKKRAGMPSRSSSPPPGLMPMRSGRVGSKARPGPLERMGPLARMAGSMQGRGGASRTLGRLKFPGSGAGSEALRRLARGGLSQTAEDVLEGAEDESDDDGSSEGEDDETARVKVTCLSADESPAKLFLCGHNSNLDCTLWLQEVFHDGRALYENEQGNSKLRWDRFKQRWALQVKGQLLWDDALGNTSDCPDPSLARCAWERLVESSRPASASSISSSSSAGIGLATDIHETFAIIEGEEDEEDQETERRKGATLEEELPGEENKPRWVAVPSVKCLVVETPPAKIFVTGVGSKTDFTGIFSIDPGTAGERRPAYTAERVGFATPCRIRYMTKQGRWIIERVPQLKGRHIRIAQKSESMTFVLAGAQYDAPYPTLIQSSWEVRQGENWLPEERIKCRVVQEPPQCVCLFGEYKNMDFVSGTFHLVEDGRDRPTYRKRDSEQTVLYCKESKCWVLSDTPGDLPRGALSVECNVPNPVETHDTVWKAWSPSTQSWTQEDSFGCYAGELPPKQLFCTGGRPGLAGVYTFMFRKLHNGHFAYRKEGTGWHAWWSSRLKRWVVGMLHKSELETKVEKGGASNFADAWCSDDVPHPALCKTWRFKARRWAPGCRTNTTRGVITKPEIADALGERPFGCMPVGEPPKVITVTHADDRKIMAGIYFLADELHAKRCYYLKQHNARRREEWAIYYNAPTGRWHIDRHGLKQQGRAANASIACDSPDPTLVWGKWNVRHSDTEMSSRSLNLKQVSEVPKKVFVFGASLKRVSGGQSTKEDLPMNGVYLLRDAFHFKRASYVKEVCSDWVIRFHTGSARWIVDDRGLDPSSKDTLRNDSHGSGSVLHDCWQPTDSDWCWSLWLEAKPKKTSVVTKQQTQQPEGEDILDDAATLAVRPKRLSRAGPSSGSIADLAPRASSSTNLGSGTWSSQKGSSVIEGRLTLSKINAVLGKTNAPKRDNEEAPTIAAGNDEDSGSDGSKSGISGISGLAGGRHLSSRMSASGRSVKSKISMCSSIKSGRTRSISGSSMHSGTSSRSGGATNSGDSKDSGPKAQQYEAWVECPSIRVVAVGEEPQRIHVGPTEPADVGGIYALGGYSNGRPFYRLVNPDGKPKRCSESCGPAAVEVDGGVFTESYRKQRKSSNFDAAAQSRRESGEGVELLVGDSSADDSSSAAGQSRPSSPRGSSSASAGPGRNDGRKDTARRTRARWRQAGAFDFSPYGYALRWHPPSGQWILGEFCTTFEVTYEHMAPRFDISLEGGRGEVVRVAFLRDHGPASSKGVPLGSELISIDDDAEMFRYQDAEMLLRDTELPVTLTFKGEGIMDNTDGLMYMRYDAPFPHSVGIPWLVPFEGGFFFPVEKPVQACRVECPPRRVHILGHKGKSKDLQAPFELLPMLFNGKPAYQSGRWSLFWVPGRRRWTIMRADILADSLANKKALAFANCHAPHPAAVADHGGRWQMRHLRQRRGMNVIALTPNIELSEYEEIVVSSLQTALEEASERKSVQAKVVDGRMRFDPQKIESALTGLNTVLTEVAVFSMQSELVKKADNIRRQLSGWLNLEILLIQGEKEHASTASWMEALTELKARLLQDHADATVTYEEDGWTTLHIIARYGFNEAWTYEAAGSLRHCGAELDARDAHGASPTIVAVAHRKYENVRAFLRLVSERAVLLPIDLKAKQEAENKFLQEAENGQSSADLRQFIMNKQIDVNSRGAGLKTALHILSLRNQAAAVELLVKEAGAEPDLRDAAGDTALHCAAVRNGYLTALTLLRLGASPIIRNSQGKTAFMEAIEAGAIETVNEMTRRMVAWEDIEGVIGRQRHRQAKDWRHLVCQKVRELIRLGFGDEKADPLKLKGRADKLQLANQVVLVDPGPGAVRCCLLELRGALLCQELLIPLLQLAGECRLQADDGVAYASFLRYILSCGLAVFGGVDVELAVVRGLSGLRSACRQAVMEVQDELRVLTPREELMVGRAAGDARGRQPWPTCHQHFAHGDLPWLSSDGRRRDLLSVLGTLVEEEEFQSVELLSHAVISDKDLVQSPTSSPEVKMMMKPFWETVYARWLVRYAKKGMKKLEAFCKRWGDCCRMGEMRSLKSVLEAKDKYREDSWRMFGGEGEHQIEEGVPMPTHLMEAGGVTDILHCLISVNEIEDFRQAFTQMRSFTLENDGAEVVFVRNAFWKDTEEEEEPARAEEGEGSTGPMPSCPNVCFCIMVEVPGTASCPTPVPVLMEARLFLQRHDVLRQHVELLQGYCEGEYSEVNQGVRQAMGFRAINQTLRNGQRRPLPKFITAKRRFALPSDMPGITELKLRDKVWCWSKLNQLEDAGLLTLPEAAEVLTGDPMMQGSMIFTTLHVSGRSDLERRLRSRKAGEAVAEEGPPRRWRELRGNGEVEDMTEENFANSCKDGDPFVSKAELVEYMSHEPWLCLEEKDVDRLLMEVCCHEVRLFLSPSGVLAKMRDFVVLHIKRPGCKAMLMRESLPCSFPMAVRRNNESPAVAAKRAINNDVPAFLHSQLEVREFEPEHGAWLEPELTDEQAKEQGTIPVWKRTFVVKVKFKRDADPFALLRAAISVDEREDIADDTSDEDSDEADGLKGLFKAAKEAKEAAAEKP